MHRTINDDPPGEAKTLASLLGLNGGGSTTYTLPQCVNDCRSDDVFVMRFNQLTGHRLDASGQLATSMSAEADFRRFVYDTVWCFRT